MDARDGIEIPRMRNPDATGLRSSRRPWALRGGIPSMTGMHSQAVADQPAAPRAEPPRPRAHPLVAGGGPPIANLPPGVVPPHLQAQEGP